MRAFSSVMTLTLKQRRRLLVFADEIAALAARCPDNGAKSGLYSIAGQLRRRYGFSDDEKRHEILRTVRCGASTVRDIVTETGFSRPEVMDKIRALEAAGLLLVQRLSISMRGRPALLIFPAAGDNVPQSVITSKKQIKSSGV